MFSDLALSHVWVSGGLRALHATRGCKIVCFLFNVVC